MRCSMKNGIFEIVEEGKITFHVTVDKRQSHADIELFKQLIENSSYEVVQHRRLTVKQMRTIWLICSDYAFFTGYTREDMREMLVSEFCARNDIPEFSISPMKSNACDVSTANDLIQFILDHALSNGFYLVIADREEDRETYKFDGRNIPDIYRHVMHNFLNRTCCICGDKADLHHEPPIGSLQYQNDDGMQTGFLPLCRKHHTERHNIPASEFLERYHIQPIKLTENLLIYLCSADIYPNQFAKFRRDYKQTIQEAKEILKKGADLI